MLAAFLARSKRRRGSIDGDRHSECVSGDAAYQYLKEVKLATGVFARVLAHPW